MGRFVHSRIVVSLLAGVACVAVAAPAKHAAPKTAATIKSAPAVVPEPRSAVIEALLAGRDARPAIAEAMSQAKPSVAMKASSPSSTALGGYAAQLRQTRAALDAARNAHGNVTKQSARTRLRDALDGFPAQRLLLDARVEQLDHDMTAATTPAVVQQRWKSARAALVAAADTFAVIANDLAVNLKTQRADEEFSQARLAELDAALAVLQGGTHAPTYGANLPVNRPRLPARDPAMTPNVVPSYADASQDIAPQASDLGAGDEAPQSAAIQAQALSLGHDYTRILDFVRSQVRTQWYAGSQKGAEGTLRTLAGNDVDQASLLIALLRASGGAARYVRGVIEVPQDDLAAMLGVRADKIGLALSAAGIANRPVVRGGRIAAYAIEQVFVSAYLPISNYRGTAADLAGRTWLPLAPALKPHSFVAASGALSRAAIVVTDFVQQYLSSPQTLAPLDLLRQKTSDALSHLSPPLSYESQLARLTVNAAPLELLPASLPYPATAITGEFATLPDALRQHAHIVVRAGSDAGSAVSLDRTLPVSQLLDHRITVSYAPASIDDGRLADRFGGLGNVPPSLIHVRPVLNIAGLPAANGTAEIETGADHRIEVTLDSPGGSVSFAQQVTAAGIAALVLDGQADHPLQQADNATLIGESETGAARLLANFGARYLSNWDDADDELARLTGVSVMRPFPSAALVINQYRVERVAGVVDSMTWKGVALDAAMRPSEPFAQVDNSAERDFLLLASLQGSVLEHQLFEQQWHVESLSADKGLALARASGAPVLTLTGATGTAGVNQPQAVLDDIQSWLQRGYVVEVPRDPLTVQAWTGAVWRVSSTSTGETGYFLSGGLAGGATVLPPELWFFQDLVDLLAKLNSLAPNTDPNAGVTIQLDGSAEGQSGVVGTTLPKPLAATVIDASGHPVKGSIRRTIRSASSPCQRMPAALRRCVSNSARTRAISAVIAWARARPGPNGSASPMST